MTKICIIGAGIAGITLAKELSNQSNFEILLIESGKNKGKQSTLNKEFKVRSKSKSKSSKFSLYEREYHYSQEEGWLSNLERLRFRGIGGSANFWGSESQLFTKEDVSINRNGYGHWPIKYHELEKYYNIASKLFKYDLKYLSQEKKAYQGFFKKIYWSQNYEKKFLINNIMDTI